MTTVPLDPAVVGVPVKARGHTGGIVTAFVLAGMFLLAVVEPAFAQDVLGVDTVREAVILVFKAIAAIGVAFMFLKLLGGRHEIAALVVGAVGVLGIAKLEAILGVLGL